MKYDYFEAVKTDVLDNLYETIEYIDMDKISNLDDLKEALNDAMFIDDAVTGNASGSYFCNTWKAEECLCHNMDLIEEVANAFGDEPTITAGWEHGAEWWDVSIRCYYLSQAIDEVVNDLEDDLTEMINARA